MSRLRSILSMMMPWVLGGAVVAPALAAPAAEPAPQIVGGWAKAPVADPQVLAAAAFAVEAQEQVLQASPARVGAKPEQHLKLLNVRSAEQQVVAGMNYRLQLSVQHNGKTRQAETLVWWQSWREPQPYQLTSWRWR